MMLSDNEEVSNIIEPLLQLLQNSRYSHSFYLGQPLFSLWATLHTTPLRVSWSGFESQLCHGAGQPVLFVFPPLYHGANDTHLAELLRRSQKYTAGCTEAAV